MALNKRNMLRIHSFYRIHSFVQEKCKSSHLLKELFLPTIWYCIIHVVKLQNYSFYYNPTNN